MAQTTPGSWLPKGHQHFSSPATSTALTVPTGARFALITTASSAIKLMDTGAAATTGAGGNGLNIPVGTVFQYTGDLSAVRIIQVTAGAEVDVLYYA